MTESPQARTIRTYWEQCWNERRTDLLADVFHDPYTHGRTRFTPALHADIVRETVASLPDLRVHVDELLDLGDTVITRSRFVGTHGGDLYGLPATGRSVEGASLDVYTFDGGRVSRLWHLFDHLPLVLGLGDEIRVDGVPAVFD